MRDLQCASTAELVDAAETIARELARRTVSHPDPPGSSAECMDLTGRLATAIDISEAALAGLIRRVDASDEPARWGYPSSSAWLRNRLGMREGRARERLTLARRLPRLHRTTSGLVSGALSYGHATTICDALTRLDDRDAAAGEHILLDLTDQGVSPGKVAVAGRRIIELIAERDGHEPPPAQTRRGYARSWIITSRALDGGRYINAYLNAEDTAIWDAALTPLTKPAGADDPRDKAERTAAALTSILSGGHHTANVTVVMDLATLSGENHPAHLADGTPIPAEQARRIALTAGVSALILGPRSRPLYYGYRRRFATTHQRHLLQIQYPACAVQGCEIPGLQCEVDHVNGFALGHSPTDIDKLALCCTSHNRFKSTHPERVHVDTTVDGRYVYRIFPPTEPRAGPGPDDEIRHLGLAS